MAREPWLPPGSLPFVIGVPLAAGLAAGLLARAASAASRPSAARPPAPPSGGAPPPGGGSKSPRPAAASVSSFVPAQPPSATFASRVAAMTEREYPAAVMAEVAAGRVPPSCAHLAPVRVSANGRSGVFWATSMPLCVGDDAAPFHAPLSAPDAQRVADALGFSLPTRRMVDAIHAQADVRVPFRSYPSPRESPRTYAESSAAIEQRRAGRGGLVSGFAKDYVLTNLRRRDPNRIAIYGAWGADGALVQPFGTPHGLNYFDYSQQPRFVAQVVEVDGVRMPLAAALADPATAPLFSHEGPITGAMLRY